MACLNFCFFPPRFMGFNLWEYAAEVCMICTAASTSSRDIVWLLLADTWSLSQTSVALQLLHNLINVLAKMDHPLLRKGRRDEEGSQKVVLLKSSLHTFPRPSQTAILTGICLLSAQPR